MTANQRIRNLSVPCGKVDVVLDTDAFNEIDDQYAISYLIRSSDKLDTKAIYAAPYTKPGKLDDPGKGMELSYEEIFRVLDRLGESRPVFRGSTAYLPDEKTPVISDAARDLAQRVENYSPENPLYIVAIGAITNVASAILLNPKVCENAVVVWLGGHAMHYHDNHEFNARQDVAAVRVVYTSGVPFVQLPCCGVVSAFTLSRPDLDAWLVGKSEIADYLAKITIEEMERRGWGDIWAKPIWDVTAVAWLLNDNNRFMLSRTIKAPLPTYEHTYCDNPDGYDMTYVYHINNNELLRDLVAKLTKM